MTETINQHVDSYIVKKGPKDSSLENVLSSYTKDQLGQIIDANDLSIAKSKRKAEVVEELANSILHNLENTKSFTDKEVFSTLTSRLLPNLPVQLEGSEWTEEEAKHLEVLASEGLALVTADEIYVADEVADKANASSSSDSKKEAPATKEAKPAQEAPTSNEEKKVVYKANASFTTDLKEQKQKRQDFLKKMARKKKKGKKRK